MMGEDSDLDDDDVRPNNQPGQAVYGDYDHIKSLDALDARGKSGQVSRLASAGGLHQIQPSANNINSYGSALHRLP